MTDFRPWQKKSEPMRIFSGDNDFTEIPIVYTDYACMASELGANDEGLELAIRAKKTAEQYISEPSSATDWLSDRLSFSVQDLLGAFTHGCRNASDTNSVLLMKTKYTEKHGHHIIKLDPLCTFIVLMSRCIANAACYSTECDGTIRWYLYNDDWLRNFCQFTQSSREIVRVFDARSLDFFLPNINSNDWNSSWNTSALLDQIDSIANALELVGRSEEAKILHDDLNERRKAFIKLKLEIPPGKPRNTIRLEAERIWVEYVGQRAWEALLPESRSDLIDSYAAEKAVIAGFYKSWRYPLQSILYVIERELNHSLFRILEKFVGTDTEFHVTSSRSTSRKKTYDSIVRAKTKGSLLTLGELSFVLNFWNDKIMDECTNLFSKSRNYLYKIAGSSEVYVETVKSAFRDTFGCIDPPWDMVKLRNSCAHPGNEKQLHNADLHRMLRKTLGEPPRKLIQTIVLELRGQGYVSNKAYDLP